MATGTGNTGGTILPAANPETKDMEEFFALQQVVTIATLGAIFVFGLIAWIATNAWLGFGTFFLLLFGFVWHGLYYISADPPTRALPLVRGKIINRLIGPGWIFVPLRGLLLLDFELWPVTEFALRFTIEEIVPDRTEVEIPTEVYGIIDQENPAPIVRMGGPITGLAEAKKRLQEQIEQRERLWLWSPQEGPMTINEAMRMGDEVIVAILDKLVGNDIQRVHSSIPTEAVLGFLKQRPLTPIEEKWKTDAFLKLTQQERDQALGEARNLLLLVEQARSGELVFRLHALGLIITRLGTDNIQPSGGSREAAAKVAAAKFDAEQRKIEADSIKAEAQGYEPLTGGKDALQNTLIRRGMIEQKISVTKIDASSEIVEAVKGLPAQLFAGLKALGVGQGRKDDNSADPNTKPNADPNAGAPKQP